MTTRRMKNYTGSQGTVYEYYFVGQREALPGSVEGATEYIFDVIFDRQLMAVSVFVQPQALVAWSERHGRELSSAEQFAAAKLLLFHCLEEELLSPEQRQFVLSTENVEAVLEPLEQNG